MLAERIGDGGVFLHPCEEQAKELGWFRLVFTQEEETVAEGIRRYVPPFILCLIFSTR